MSDAQFTVVNHDTEQTFVEDSRADADDRRQNGIDEFGFSDEDLDVVTGAYEDYADVPDDAATDGGEAAVVESEAQDDPEGTDWQPGDEGTPAAKAAQPTPTESDLPDDPNLTDDAFAWMPGHFVDDIEGTPTINRRGYAALGRKFGISAPDIEVKVGPEETDHTYCRVKATVEDADGRTYQNHGSASVERGDDATLLLELATTRARKRALAGATGVGLIAVEELKSEL